MATSKIGFSDFTSERDFTPSYSLYHKDDPNKRYIGFISTYISEPYGSTVFKLDLSPSYDLKHKFSLDKETITQLLDFLSYEFPDAVQVMATKRGRITTSESNLININQFNKQDGDILPYLEIQLERGTSIASFPFVKGMTYEDFMQLADYTRMFQSTLETKTHSISSRIKKENEDDLEKE